MTNNLNVVDQMIAIGAVVTVTSRECGISVGTTGTITHYNKKTELFHVVNPEGEFDAKMWDLGIDIELVDAGTYMNMNGEVFTMKDRGFNQYPFHAVTTDGKVAPGSDSWQRNGIAYHFDCYQNILKLAP